MTNPNNEAIQAAPQPPMPDQFDQQSRWGWTHPLHIDIRDSRYWVDLHKTGSLATALAASAAATMIYAAGNDTSPEANVRWHDTTVHHQTTSRYTEQDASTDSHHISHEISPAPPQSLSLRVSAANMPDVASFDLSKTPDAQVIIGQHSFDGFINKVAARVHSGWRISDVSIIGTSSDETRLDSNAGIGKEDSKNVNLAYQYGAFVTKATRAELKRHGIAVPAEFANGDAEEEVLDPQQVKQFDELRHTEGFHNNLQLIEAYKSDPSKLKPATVATLHKLLDTNRGADITITLASPKGKTVTTTYDTITKHCLTVDTTRETSNTTKEHDPKHFPIMILPIPWARVRRRPREDQTEAEPARVAATPDAEPARDPLPTMATYYYGVRERDTNLRTSIRGARRLRDHINTEREPYYSSSFHSAYHEDIEAVQQRFGASSLDELEQMAGQAERRAWARVVIGSALTAGLIGLVPLVIKGDVGYCPDPQDHRQQSWRWNDAPDYLDLRLHVPFTNIDSARTIDLAEGPCGQSPQPQPRSPGMIPPVAEPTCDTRTLVYRDGKLVTDYQTRFPGATSTTIVDK